MCVYTCYTVSVQGLCQRLFQQRSQEILTALADEKREECADNKSPQKMGKPKRGNLPSQYAAPADKTRKNIFGAGN